MSTSPSASRPVGGTSLAAGSGGAARLNAIDWVAFVLLIVGGLNWGLVGAFNFDLVAALFGTMTILSRAVYVLVGLSALWGIALAMRLANARR